jgi:Phage late-transcription coactivator
MPDNDSTSPESTGDQQKPSSDYGSRSEMAEVKAQFNDLEQTFHQEIEKLCSEHQLNYIDGTIFFVERRGIEPEFLGELIKNNLPLLAKIQRAGEDLNFLKPVRRLAQCAQMAQNSIHF